MEEGKCIEYEKIIKTCIISQKQVSIEREEIDDEPITAIPIMASQNLLLIHYLYDFYLDGYKVINMEDITLIRRGKIEEYELAKNEPVLLQEDSSITGDEVVSIFDAWIYVVPDDGSSVI